MGQPSFRFTKLNAAGNDFVCLDSTNGEYAALLWGRVKEIDGQLLHGLLGRLVQARHVCGLRYWQSRGGILPWSIALGGEAFFQAVIARSECVVEPPPEVRQGEGTTT